MVVLRRLEGGFFCVAVGKTVRSMTSTSFCCAGLRFRGEGVDGEAIVLDVIVLTDT